MPRPPFSPVLFLLAALCLTGCLDEGSKQSAGKQGGPPPPAPVVAVAARAFDLPRHNEWVGRVQAVETVEIRSRVEGFLQEQHFTEGGLVDKGQLLFVIDQRQFEQSLREARAQLTRTGRSLDLARKDAARYAELFEQNVVSRNQYEVQLTKQEELEADYLRYQAAVDTALLQLSFTRITSPLSGVIGKSLMETGSLVNAADRSHLADVSTVDPMHVDFAVSEDEYLQYTKDEMGRARRAEGNATAKASLAPDIQVRLFLADGGAYPHPGRLIMVDRAVDPATGTIGVRASFPNPDLLLRSGMFARVRVVVDEGKSALMVPQVAVMHVLGSASLYVAGEDGTLQGRQVELGQRAGALRVVEKGLKPGELVVVSGLQKLRPGMPVKPTAAPYDAKGVSRPAQAPQQTPQAAGQ